MNQRKYKKYLKKKGLGYHACRPCILTHEAGALVKRVTAMKQHRVRKDLKTIRRRELRQNSFLRWLKRELMREYLTQMDQKILYGEMRGPFADMIPMTGKYKPYAG